jgi:hypothetical protein
VKSKISLAILFTYLVASTELHQVFKLPLLFQHYTEHKVQVQEMTFLEFLVMHYKTDVAHDDQDMKLPFKDCHHSATSSITAIPVQNISIQAPPASPDEELWAVNQNPFHSSLLDEIFQPPRS